MLAFAERRGEDVVTTPVRVFGKTGYPKTIRGDQGSKFICRDVDLRAYQRGVTLGFTRLEKLNRRLFTRGPEAEKLGYVVRRHIKWDIRAA